ncbi:ribosome biogenesis protein WDR12-like [Anneissia japonica]|uniref:ribosome biogenesis protein WDR12-like n=1 Tax=Anneissia japonica TaxID=1529436 RepID=UPI001425ADA1|nr:ribosome biogenesis protein WDR12-like [Anneissia japonica]
MEDPTSSGSHLQARFVTKQQQYAVPEFPFSVPANVGASELSALINKLLNEEKAEEDVEQLDFDFLIDGELLRVSVSNHMEEKGISSETVVEIEYFQKHPAPTPEGSLLHDDWISCVQGCNDRIVTGCYDNSVRLWNVKGDNLMTLSYHSDPVKCVSWIKKDGPTSLLVSGSHDQSLIIWEVNEEKKTCQALHSCRGHARSVDSVAVNKSGTKICSGSFDSMLKIWSAVPGTTEDVSERTEDQHRKKIKADKNLPLTRTPLMTLDGHREAVSSVLWYNDNEVCSASWDHTIQFWDVETGVQKSTLTGTKVFLSIALSECNGMIASGNADRHIRIWDPRSSEGAVVKSSLSHHNGWVTAVDWSRVNSNQLISGSYDQTFKLWDIRSSKAPLYNMSGLGDKVLAVNWNIPELLLFGGADNCLHIFHSSEIISR